MKILIVQPEGYESIKDLIDTGAFIMVSQGNEFIYTNSFGDTIEKVKEIPKDEFIFVITSSKFPSHRVLGGIIPGSIQKNAEDLAISIKEINSNSSVCLYDKVIPDFTLYICDFVKKSFSLKKDLQKLLIKAYEQRD